MTYQELIAQLDTLSDPTVASYQNTIISDTSYPMRCIRMPVLRKLAQTVAREDWRTLLANARLDSYEEVMVMGLAVAYAKMPLADKLEALWHIIPRLDSWALTDCIVPTLKIKENEKELAWKLAMECLADEKEYTIRFGIILLLDYFLTPDRIPQTALCLTAIRDERYYVRMAIRWCLAEMSVHDYDRVENILKSGVLDTFTHNMTIRKVRESYRICAERKIAVAAFRRKEKKNENFSN